MLPCNQSGWYFHLKEIGSGSLGAELRFGFVHKERVTVEVGVVCTEPLREDLSVVSAIKFTTTAFRFYLITIITACFFKRYD